MFVWAADSAAEVRLGGAHNEFSLSDAVQWEACVRAQWGGEGGSFSRCVVSELCALHVDMMVTVEAADQNKKPDFVSKCFWDQSVFM